MLQPLLTSSPRPLIGAALVSRFDWRWTEWLPIFLLTAIYIGIVFMKETYRKTLLQRRAAKSAASKPTIARISIGKYITVLFIRPLHMLFTEPIVGLFSLYVAFNFALLYAFFASFPYVFETVYKFDLIQQGLVFLSMAVGFVLAIIGLIALDFWTNKWIQSRSKLFLNIKVESPQEIVPEDRLYAAMLGSIGLPISLFWFAWTARPGIHPLVSISSLALFAGAQLSVFVRYLETLYYLSFR
jgi:hypothetical protein